MYAGKKDWHQADIIAALRKKGTSLAALSRQAGLSSATLANALSRPWPKGEWLIAEALNIHPSEIWPSRYYDPVTQRLLDRKKLIRVSRSQKTEATAFAESTEPSTEYIASSIENAPSTPEGAAHAAINKDVSSDLSPLTEHTCLPAESSHPATAAAISAAEHATPAVEQLNVSSRVTISHLNNVPPSAESPGHAAGTCAPFSEDARPSAESTPPSTEDTRLL